MNVQELFNGDGFAKQVSGFGDLSKFGEVTDYFKKSERKGDQVSGLLCPKLTELPYKRVKRCRAYAEHP